MYLQLLFGGLNIAIVCIYIAGLKAICKSCTVHVHIQNITDYHPAWFTYSNVTFDHTFADMVDWDLWH